MAECRDRQAGWAEREESLQAGHACEVRQPDGKWATGTIVTPPTRGPRPTVKVTVAGQEQEVRLGLVDEAQAKQGPVESDEEGDAPRVRRRTFMQAQREFIEWQKAQALSARKQFSNVGGGVHLTVGRRASNYQQEAPEPRAVASIPKAPVEEQRRGPSFEHQAKMAALMAKYGASGPAAKQRKTDREGPERGWLG